MEVVKTKLEGVLLLKPKVYGDIRGYFYESFSVGVYAPLGISGFVQDNISKSVKNTVRGLHYQVGANAQGKLCQVLSGRVLDIAVDIRFGSPTFGEHIAVELSEENHLQLWVPPGFAHGFAVLSDSALFMYKCTALYDKGAERAIFYSDAQLAIDWQTERPIISEKDRSACFFKNIEKDFIWENLVEDNR